jgi:hypothetical protein
VLGGAADMKAGGEEDGVRGSAEAQSPKVLRVGVFCEMGRHRSVAFVEELSRRKWPREWVVEVVHRDVDRRRNWGEGKDANKARDKRELS